MKWVPCPYCGYRFSFELTGCATGIQDTLETNGHKCPQSRNPIGQTASTTKVDNPLTLEENRRLPILQMTGSLKIVNNSLSKTETVILPSRATDRRCPPIRVNPCPSVVKKSNHG